MSSTLQNKRILPSQDSIEIQTEEDGTLILCQSSANYENQTIYISKLYVDEFLNQLKLTIAGE